MKNEPEIINVWFDLSEELYKFIIIKVKDDNIAKDILHDVYLKVQSKSNQLKDPSKITSWIYQITRNVIIDNFRKSNTSNISIQNIDIPDIENQDVDFTHLSNCINQKIDSLSEKYKQAIILTSFKKYSQKELAKYLKISYSGAKSRVQKARNDLRTSILNCPNTDSSTLNNF